MGYEAQIAGVGDNFSCRFIKNSIIKLLKKRSIKELRNTREASVNLLKESGFAIKIVNGGGTGSLESTREEACVTELTVGSGFFNSHLFDNYSNFIHNALAMFATEIVRIPKPGMVTCLGG